MSKKYLELKAIFPSRVLAHNIFAIHVLSPTFGISDWIKQLKNLYIKTRKILTASGKILTSIECIAIVMAEEG